MTRQEKDQLIENLAEKLRESENFYLTDVSGLNSAGSGDLRRLCFNKGVELKVVKNTLLKKAMEKAGGDGYEGTYEVLKGNTALMFAESGALPAKLIKEFRKKYDRPVLKAAFVEQSLYLGDEQVDLLAALKSKTEMIAEVIGLLQSPAKNVISALQSGGTKLSGILSTLEKNPVSGQKEAVAPGKEDKPQDEIKAGAEAPETENTGKEANEPEEAVENAPEEKSDLAGKKTEE